MPRSLARPLAVACALAVAALALTGCTQAPAAKKDSCAGLISKVLLTDDSATTVANYSASSVPKAFAIPATPAPTCYYSTVTTLPPSDGVVETETHRTLLYIGLSDSQAADLVAAMRKTVSVAPWTVRFDHGAPIPAPTPTASPSAAPGVAAATSSSARWYYNFSGAASDDKGEMGYYASVPMTQGIAIQAGLSKPVNMMRIETELRQVKK